MFRIGWQEKSNTNSRRSWARPVRRPWNQGRSLTLEILEERTLLSFLDGVNYDVGKTPWSVAVGDLTGNGIPDLVTANIHENTASVLLGNGDGTFQAARSVGIGAPTYGVAVGDFNGDGVPDLAFASYDIVCDGEECHYLSNDVRVLLGNGDGSFEAPTSYPTGVAPSSVAVGDFNGDGVPDLAVANAGSNDVSVLLGNGDGTFQPPRNYAAGEAPGVVTVADLNGDGRLDLVSVNSISQSTVNVLLGNGDGSFQPRVTYSVGAYARGVAVGHFHDPNILDLAVPNSAQYGGSPSLSVLRGNGDGTFQTAVNYDAGSHPSSVAVGDFNQDGILDLVVANNGSYPFYTDGDVSVLLGNGDGSFQAPLSYHAGESPYAVVVDDFNGDGFPDVAAANWHSNNVTVLLNAVDWTAPATSTTVPVSMFALRGDSANALGSRAFVFIPSTAETPLTRTAALTTEAPNPGQIFTSAPGGDRGLGLPGPSHVVVATEGRWLDDFFLEEPGVEGAFPTLPNGSA